MQLEAGEREVEDLARLAVDEREADRRDVDAQLFRGGAKDAGSAAKELVQRRGFEAARGVQTVREMRSASAVSSEEPARASRAGSKPSRAGSTCSTLSGPSRTMR